MKLPAENFSIKIGPFFYSIVYSFEVTNERREFGCTDNNNKKIFIDPTKDQQTQEETFLHEIIHAIHFVNGLIYRFDRDKIDLLPTEEDVTRETSVILYQVLKDNPNIFI